MSTQPPFTEGKIEFKYKDETFQTYYKIFGDITKSPNPPVIVKHGGPGLVHNYLLCHSDLTTQHDIPVILYDQIGNGRSTHLKEKEKSFWTLDLFIQELENLINHFRIENAFHLLGHSWGGILACEFAVQRKPKGLKKIVLTDSLASSELWNQSNAQLLQGFSDDVKAGIIGGMSQPEKFWDALQKFHAVHGCTVKPVPQDFLYTMLQVFGPDGDPTVASAPILNKWSIIGRLNQIKATTLIINGRNDISQDFVVWPFFTEIEKVKWVRFENSSHTPCIEERERYMEVVGKFLIH